MLSYYDSVPESAKDEDYIVINDAPGVDYCRICAKHLDDCTGHVS